MTKLTCFIPIKTVSEANSSEHWLVKSKRHQQQQFFIRLSLSPKLHEITLPCKITLTRLARRDLDLNDNLPMAFKWIKDEISELLVPESAKEYVDKKGKTRKLKGRADDDTRITWVYSQEKAKILGIRIDIECEDEACTDHG